MTILLNSLVPLFVPGNRPDRFEKAANAGADAVIVDLEDAVPATAKDAARSALRSGFTALPIFVRVNGIGTPYHEADMAALSGHGFAAVIVPKAEATPSFAKLCAISPIQVIALIETAHGLGDAHQIASTQNVARLAFGSIDFCADLGCAHSREVLLAARSEIVLASRIAGIAAPIDGVTAAVDDIDLIDGDARHARDLGFGGKLCIHPRQIQAIRAGFMPDSSDIRWAEKIVASGDGATSIDGAMVDAPVRARAQTILRQAGMARGA